jgi:hypothetical protein
VKKKVLNNFENCCNYKNECVKEWANQMRKFSARFVFIATGCERALGYSNNFKKCDFLEEINEKLMYYTNDFLLEKFVKDSGDFGLKKTVEKIYHNKRAKEIVENLKNDYSYFDWDAIKFDTKKYQVYHHPDYYLCGSRVFNFYHWYYNPNLLVSWCIPGKITEAYNRYLTGKINKGNCNGLPEFKKEDVDSIINSLNKRDDLNYVLCVDGAYSSFDSFGNFIEYGGGQSSSIPTSTGGGGVFKYAICVFSGYPNPHPVQKTNIKLSNLAILFRKTEKAISFKCNKKIENFEFRNIQVPGKSTSWIMSKRVTNWGEWGAISYCNNSFAIGFRIKAEAVIRGDNTAMNGLQLICENNQLIQSSVGKSGA